MQNCSYSTIYFLYWFSCRQLEHSNKCGLPGLVEIINLYVLVSWKSSRCLVKETRLHLTSVSRTSHTVVTIEMITIAVLSDVSKRPAVHFPPLFTIHTPKGGTAFSSDIFPWLIYSKRSLEVICLPKPLGITRILVFKRWKSGHKNPHDKVQCSPSLLM